MRGEIMAGSMRGRLLYRVFTPDERSPEHRHICHLAKFERNRTVRGRVTDI